MSSTRRKPKPKSKRKGGHPAGRPGAVAPARFGDWVGGARLRTLPLAIAPVLVGTGAAVDASDPGVFHWIRAILCLVVALCLQIGVNYANDYSDGIRGTDAYRIGPSRLTGSGKAKPRVVLAVALVFFGLAALAGLLLVVASQQWWLLIVGAAAIAAAWFYTGGKHPYGYYGLGEIFVFVFFGLVATAGTMYVQVLNVSQVAWFGAVAVGLFACAVLVVNNLRDIAVDEEAGKRTLSVLIGRAWSRVLFAIFVLVPFLILALISLIYTLGWLGFFTLIAAVPAVIIALFARTPRELIISLQLTSISALAYAAFLAAALAWSPL
ncbi:1,4-dihydroxy-2-naphthoate polyprenyltransferase [Humibacter sp. RRB41]|uniref:1,4-dihydroxy-2-naphthoate polyprenyltransferase n=1 Tax=Humibacter sp. RRB41 TaxID=2919946 RepID=UPI001FAAFB43|nr:1,4-dihydroxy-2-naphthoate polyprenyltransferase [Humibacter sp. RRB41]